MNFILDDCHDVLHLEKQPEIALGLGYKQENIFRRVEAVMGDYYTKAQTIHQISGILEERLVHANIGNTSKLSFKKVLKAYRASPVEKVDGFDLINDTLSSPNPNILDHEPERIIRLFRHAQRLNAKLSPDLRSWFEPPSIN